MYAHFECLHPGISSNVAYRRWVRPLQPSPNIPNGVRRRRGPLAPTAGSPRPAGHAAVGPALAAASADEATPVPSAPYAETG